MTKTSAGSERVHPAAMYYLQPAALAYSYNWPIEPIKPQQKGIENMSRERFGWQIFDDKSCMTVRYQSMYLGFRANGQPKAGCCDQGYGDGLEIKHGGGSIIMSRTDFKALVAKINDLWDE